MTASDWGPIRDASGEIIAFARGDHRAKIGAADDMLAALKQAQHKLLLYRQAHTGEYVGGVEYSELMRRITNAIAKAGGTLP